MSKINIELVIDDDPSAMDIILYRLDKITEVISLTAFVPTYPEISDKLIFSYSKGGK